MLPSLSGEGSASVSPAHQVGPRPDSLVQSAVRRRVKRTHLREYSLPQGRSKRRDARYNPNLPGAPDIDDSSGAVST